MCADARRRVSPADRRFGFEVEEGSGEREGNGGQERRAEGGWGRMGRNGGRYLGRRCAWSGEGRGRRGGRRGLMMQPFEGIPREIRVGGSFLGLQLKGRSIEDGVGLMKIK